MDPKRKKIEIIKQYVEIIKTQSLRHRKSFVGFRRKDRLSKVIVTGLSAISVSCSTITYGNLDTDLGTYLMPINVGCAAITTIASAMFNVLGFSDREHSHQTSWLQLNDLHRDITHRLLRNHLTSEDCDQLLKDISVSMSLIEDNALTDGKNKKWVDLIEFIVESPKVIIKPHPYGGGLHNAQEEDELEAIVIT